MLIIEGSDNLGKTTAAKRLVELAAQRAKQVKDGQDDVYPVRYQHMSRPNHAFNFFTDYQDMVCKYAVQDRFHLGGLVWHKDVINPHSLRIIEGWLHCLGSIVVVFVCSNEEWYKDRLVSSQRVEMFDVSVLVQANRAFQHLASGQHFCKPIIEFVVDVSGPDKFPNDTKLNTILDAWFERLRYVP